MYDLLVLSVWSRVILDFFARFKFNRGRGDGGVRRDDVRHGLLDRPGRDVGHRPSR